MQLLFILLAAIFASAAVALYGPKSDVILVNDKNFKDEVLKFNGVVIVEFFAPW